ncbi:MAG: protein kinase [Saprospiraceae bacterium]|nr:protein kinase [Saprospiraceae bacterium]
MKAAQYLTEHAGREILEGLNSLGDYQIGKVLGEGRFGVVYKATHVSTGQDVAIKFLKIWSVPDHARPNLKRRFELEFETGQIESNHLIKSVFMDQLGDIPYFIMDYCPCGNLERLLQTTITDNRKVEIAEGILHGLNDLHRNGKIHRDLKPENVLFDNLERPRLTDFGISGHINIQLTVVNHDDRPEQIFGSYAYMAPEQLSPVKRKNTLLPTIDIFSFGVLCYELFQGKLPFGPWEHFDEIDPYVRRAAKGEYDPFEVAMDPLWQEIIHRCLMPDREDRFQNTGEILSLLRPENSIITQEVSPHFSLQILDGEEYGRVYTVDLKNIAGMGRASEDSENDIPLYETITNYISRRHATFENVHGKVYLRDGQWDEDKKIWKLSKNGTFINGIKIDTQEGQVLNQEDIITVGNTSIKIF